jgi:hypothetical protein
LLGKLERAPNRGCLGETGILQSEFGDMYDGIGKIREKLAKNRQKRTDLGGFRASFGPVVGFYMLFFWENKQARVFS